MAVKKKYSSTELYLGTVVSDRKLSTRNIGLKSINNWVVCSWFAEVSVISAGKQYVTGLYRWFAEVSAISDEK